MDAPFTLPFAVFWKWLQKHANCIIRAGAPDAALYDDEDLHWAFQEEADGLFVVQMARGKRLVSELFLEPDRIDYIQAIPPQVEEEHVFELISESAGDRIAAYFFVLVHGYEDEDRAPSQRRIH